VIFLTPHIISGEMVSTDVVKYQGLTQKLEKQLTQKEIKEVEEAEAEAIQTAETRKVFPPSEKEALKEEVAKKRPSVKKDVAQKEMTREEYFSLIRNMVYEKVKENLPPQPMKGQVEVSFFILPDGSLKGAPVILKPVEEPLKESASKSVQAAAPFPPFPKNFMKRQEEVKIAIIYE
jgi:TonB family protein